VRLGLFPLPWLLPPLLPQPWRDISLPYCSGLSLYFSPAAAMSERIWGVSLGHGALDLFN
jgi:hypothetical protein